VGKADVVLAPFWEFVLDRSPDDMKTRMVMASHFVKINLGFILKWPEKVGFFLGSFSLSPNAYGSIRCWRLYNRSRTSLNGC
jgi:hypothetical protein